MCAVEVEKTVRVPYWGRTALSLVLPWLSFFDSPITPNRSSFPSCLDSSLSVYKYNLCIKMLSNRLYMNGHTDLRSRGVICSCQR